MKENGVSSREKTMIDTNFKNSHPSILEFKSKGVLKGAQRHR